MSTKLWRGWRRTEVCFYRQCFKMWSFCWICCSLSKWGFDDFRGETQFLIIPASFSTTESGHFSAEHSSGSVFILWMGLLFLITSSLSSIQTDNADVQWETDHPQKVVVRYLPLSHLHQSCVFQKSVPTCRISSVTNSLDPLMTWLSPVLATRQSKKPISCSIHTQHLFLVNKV